MNDSDGSRRKSYRCSFLGHIKTERNVTVAVSFQVTPRIRLSNQMLTFAMILDPTLLHVVGVKEWGRSPRRLVEPMNKIREISINDQVHPFMLYITIICFRISLIIVGL